MVSKMIVVVDADVDVCDAEQVWFHAGANAHPGRDVVLCEGPTHFTDHAAPVRGLGHKMGIDATRKLAGEGHPRPWPNPLRMDESISEQVTRRWNEYGFKGTR
jgi:4-hydroxy-3-polyprenylbenzoate decarboxylase